MKLSVQFVIIDAFYLYTLIIVGELRCPNNRADTIYNNHIKQAMKPVYSF